MMKKILFIFLISSISINAQTFIPYYADVANQCSSTNILNNLTQFENFGVKYRGTTAQSNTLNWLRNQYLSYGYTNAQVLEYTYSYSGATCKNLEVTKTGTLYPNTYVIVCGHFDTINGPGTNDNGSGVITILEIARLLQNIPTEYSIKFINFSGEEDGLRGSQNYVNTVVNSTTPKMDIRLVFNIDEVGGVAGEINNTITCEKDTGSPTANNAASAQFTNELITCVGHYSTLNTLLANAYGSDYMSFEENGEIITGFYETNESNYPHSANDLLVNIDVNYLYQVCKAAIGGTLHFSKAVTALSNNDIAIDEQIIIYPNPAKDNINISLGKLSSFNNLISIYDVNGKLISQKNTSLYIETIDTSNFSSGIYALRVENEKYTFIKKISIE